MSVPAVDNTPSLADPENTSVIPQGDPATDEPLGEPGKKALAAEREARKAAEKSAADLAARLKEIEAAQMSDLERAQAEANEARQALEAITRQNIRNKVALEKGVPADLVDFLTGDTEDEVTAKADALMARITTAAPATPKPDLSQGAKGAPPATTAEQFAASIEAAFTS